MAYETRLEPVVSDIHSEKLCIALHYRQFSANIKFKKHKVDTRLISLGFRPLSASITGFYLHKQDNNKEIQQMSCVKS